MTVHITLIGALAVVGGLVVFIILGYVGFLLFLLWRWGK